MPTLARLMHAQRTHVAALPLQCRQLQLHMMLCTFTMRCDTAELIGEIIQLRGGVKIDA